MGMQLEMLAGVYQVRIIVTGASGSIGRQLVPLLAVGSTELLLVGRDPALLANLFPNLRACGYGQLVTRGRNFDLLVHLAVINNDAEASSDIFHDVNVRHMLEVRGHAQQAGIAKFINISSVHALDESNRSPYAESKREGARRIREAPNGAMTLYLPIVYGSKFSGKLTILNNMPRGISSLAIDILSAFRPTLGVEKLARYIMAHAMAESDQEVILSDGQGKNMLYRFVRRAVDFGFATGVVLLLWWLILAIWVLIKVQSEGPGIFAQKRVGRYGMVFTCYKFRTMKLGTVQAATNEVSSASVTKLGHVLRQTKIDELPQVWNIFRNEVSLIGPRPCLPVQAALVEARRQRGVLELKPGITGLAQVNGIDMSEPEKLAQLDRRYGALQSLALDLNIVLATASGSGQGDNVAG